MNFPFYIYIFKKYHALLMRDLLSNISRGGAIISAMRVM